MTEETPQPPAPEEPAEYISPNTEDDDLSQGLIILSFCIPLVGAFIWLTSRDTRPYRASMACKAALWGVGVGLVGRILIVMSGGR